MIIFFYKILKQIWFLGFENNLWGYLIYIFNLLQACNFFILDRYFNMQWQSSCQCSFNFNCGTFQEIHHKVPWNVIWWIHFSVVQYNHQVIFLQGEGNDLCYQDLFCWCVNSLRNPTKNNCLMKHILNLEASILEGITF